MEPIYDQFHEELSHPAKSTLFQSHPDQLLQVYRDLDQRQKRDQELSLRRGADINEESSDDKVGSGSQSSRTRSQADNSEDGYEVSSVDGCGSDSLAALSDEEDSCGDESEDGKKSNAAKMPSTNHPKKDDPRVGATFRRKASMDGGNTLVTMASTVLGFTIISSKETDEPCQWNYASYCLS